jgi:molybdopterin synthase catalytic subunit
MVATTNAPIRPDVLYDRIGKSTAGSVIFHYAVVKENAGDGKGTTCVDYQANGNVEQELESIAGEMKTRWSLDDVLLVRRIGCLVKGDIISLVAASSPSSEDVFMACRHGLSRLKKMSTIIKRESVK